MSEVTKMEEWVKESIEEAWRDSRSTHELITVALSTDEDDATRWDAIGILRCRATREGFEAARALSGSECAEERTLGADILSQFGIPQRAFVEEILAVLCGMLEHERNAKVLESITSALGFLDHSAAVTPLLSLRQHPAAEVRWHVATALPRYYADPRVIPALIVLSEDVDEAVRDWATFGLGSQMDADTPELREALARRLDDPDGVTCAEALVGLAKRKEPRIIPKLRVILRSGDLEFATPRQDLVLEAVEELGDPSFIPDLLDLRDHFREKHPGLSEWLDQIIQELSVSS